MNSRLFFLMISSGALCSNVAQAMWRFRPARVITGAALAHTLRQTVVNAHQSYAAPRSIGFEPVDGGETHEREDRSEGVVWQQPGELLDTCAYKGNVAHACWDVMQACRDESLSEHEALKILQCVLLRGDDVNAVNVHGDTGLTSLGRALNISLLSRRETVTKAILLMLLKRADVKKVSFGEGENLLHMAVRGEHVDILPYLVAAGVDIDEGDIWGETPIHHATHDFSSFQRAMGIARSNIVECLLELGGDINKQNCKGIAPLHFIDSPEMTRLFVEKNANVNIADCRGDTPLMWAASAGANGQVKALLSHGASIEVRNNAGETALEISQARVVFTRGLDLNLVETVQLLQEHREKQIAGASVVTPQQGSSNGQVDVDDMALSKRAYYGRK